MEQYVELDNHGTQIFAEKNSADKYIFKYVRDCTYEENIIHAHARKRQFPGGYYVMRIGFYRITRIFEMEIHTLGNEMVAQVAYKENEGDPFVNLPNPVRLRPLFNYVSVCKEKQFYKNEPMGLLNKEIQIHSSELVDTEFQGEASKSYEVNWSVVQKQ